ncbi:MAG: c-type cytochrome [Verrucomicrobiales bacterium]
MARSRLKSVPKSWETALLGSLAAHPGDATIRAIGHLEVHRADRALIAVAGDPRAAADLRLAALDVVVDRLPAPLDGELFNFVTARAQLDRPADQRIDTMRILARAPLSEGQRLACAENLVSEAGPLQIGPLLGVFEKQMTPEIRAALANALENSPGLFSVSASRVETLFEDDHPTARPLIDKLRALESQRDQRLDELVGKIAERTGNPDRGKAAFTKATCFVCHRVKGEGGVIGPELTTIGAIRSKRDLLEAIAFPSATFAREYEPYLVTLKDGTVKMGRIGGESEESLELIDAQGIASHLPVNRIASREMAPLSLMPPGLERVLTDTELADLVAYLRSLN